MKSKPLEVTLNLPMMNSTEIKYNQALRLCDRPVGKMWIAQLGRLRCTLQAEIYLHEELITSATQVGCFINLETMRPMAIPNDIKEIYAQYQKVRSQK